MKNVEDLIPGDFNASWRIAFLMEHDKTYFLDTLKKIRIWHQEGKYRLLLSISYIGMPLIISHDIIALMDRQSKASQAAVLMLKSLESLEASRCLLILPFGTLLFTFLFLNLSNRLCKIISNQDIGTSHTKQITLHISYQLKKRIRSLL